MQTNTESSLATAQTSLRNRAAQSSKENGELGKNEFLNLFLTQVSHQNPTDPMDSGAMMTQLAQLGSMEQLENLNSQMKELNLKQGEAARFQSLQFLDKDVMLDINALDLSRGATKPIGFSLNKEAQNVRVLIEGADGTPITTQKLGMLTPGNHQFHWDGKNDAGTLMSDGNYRVKLLASYTDGTTDDVTPYQTGRVSNVEYKDGKPMLSVKGKQVSTSEVRSVDNSSNRIFGKAQPLPYMQELPPKGPLKVNTRG